MPPASAPSLVLRSLHLDDTRVLRLELAKTHAAPGVHASTTKVEVSRDETPPPEEEFTEEEFTPLQE
eukprot:CAMPEP_0202838302 /NCGR_PEP_ID=MMETSP1389-20130828/48937_1 /ASSEMBLY_ACC=CAM_ASM_000865 /TAXON_ID=302021 /ORGANISM="Rhodomonas sp., Strain CCMP768" /LENGTH=66 /DNA_ID=CAMNT_0049514549 /DNA_START=246 /DNA_END=447 /DNA_ORIENTATION=+